MKANVVILTYIYMIKGKLLVYELEELVALFDNSVERPQIFRFSLVTHTQEARVMYHSITKNWLASNHQITADSC